MKPDGKPAPPQCRPDNNQLAYSTAPLISRSDAERLDRRIRLLTTTIADNVEKLYGLVEQAKAGQIHVVLGYRSWTDYVADALTVTTRLDRPQRRELVSYLSGEGMSQRVIADVVGADRKTVRSDLSSALDSYTSWNLAQVGEIGPPEPDDHQQLGDLVANGYFADEQEAADCQAMGDVSDDQFETALSEAREMGDMSRSNVVNICRQQSEKTITGRDGKQYPAPPPAPKPRRRPITDAFWDGKYKLRKMVDRLERLSGDDRFRANQDTLAGANLSDLIRARDKLNRIIDLLDAGGKR